MRCKASTCNRTTAKEKLSEVKANYQFEPYAIFSVDETAINALHKPPKLPRRDVVDQEALADRGKLITLIGAGNAAGNAVPPLFVFSKKAL